MSLRDLLGDPMEEDPADGDAADASGSDEGEGAGVDLMGNHTGDEDSSEEESEGSDAEREVRAGFIEDGPETSSRKKQKRSKDKDSSKKRRKDSDDDVGDLDDDDLALLEENTGVKQKREKTNKLKRLRRHRSNSAGSDASETSVRGLRDIFADEGLGGADAAEPYDGDEMDGFIEDDESDSSGGRQGSDAESEGERRVRKAKEKKKKRLAAPKRKAQRGGFGAGYLQGMSQEMQDEVAEVFGNGMDYAFALEMDDEQVVEKELKDVFEPAEIASRMLTEGDDVIRALDIPERLQLASVGLPSLPPTEMGPAPYITLDNLEDAADWMSTRISSRCTESFLLKDDNGERPAQYPHFLTAITSAIKFLSIDFLEVPFIWDHKKDYLFYSTYNDGVMTPSPFLELGDLWTISHQLTKFRSLVHRKDLLKETFDGLEVEEDAYFEELFHAAETVEEVADLQAWVGMKYSGKLAEIKEAKAAEAEALEGPVRVKRATRDSVYDNAKKSVVSVLATKMAVSATELAGDFQLLNKTHFLEDPELGPLALAEEYSGSGEYGTAEVALAAAKMILVHEISLDPTIRKEVRRFFKDYAVVSVKPTLKGMTKIDEMHPFNAFKYLLNKPLNAFLRSSQFLQILRAESDALVTVHITLPLEPHSKLLSDLSRMYHNDYASSIAEEWNGVRTEVLTTAVDERLVPVAQAWARNWIVEEEEHWVGNQCANQLDNRINVAPYCRADGTMESGQTPTVLALSHGSGDPKRDSVIAVFLDEEGRFRQLAKFDNLASSLTREGANPVHREAFAELIKARRPQVIVVGGFSASTKRLFEDVTAIATEVSDAIFDEELDGTLNESGEPLTGEERIARAKFEITYVFDDVARIYQNSQRAAAEFSELPTLGKYCVGLARYAQSPLNEYAALGSDLTAITHDVNQKFISNDKAKLYLDRALVEVVSKVGVVVKRAVTDPYYAHILPYVCGLGPRKAESLIKKIVSSLGGTLKTRAELVTNAILTANIFVNAASYLRIPCEDLAKVEQGTDVLDMTRVHPEDYDVARKMAADALDRDEMDANPDDPSSAVTAVMLPENVAKLADLQLDDFAAELNKILGVPKRLALYAVRREMVSPYSEVRYNFAKPTVVNVFTMLTGESKATLEHGLIVPVRVIRIRQDEVVLVRLDSGIEGSIAENYRTNGQVVTRPKPGQILQAYVMELKPDDFTVELSTQENLIERGDADRRRVMPDNCYDHGAAQADKDSQVAKEQKRTGRSKRQITHPNFHNFNAGEAEQFLAHQQRGDCVIRPSSKEDHLAVTWKVDEGVYQHIAVTEIDKPSALSIGSKLRIDARHTYADLDELIASHIKAMARKVEEMMAHEKYKGTKDSLRSSLQNFTMANPGLSAYGFGLDRSDPKNAGQFVVSFRADHNSEVQSWPVKVVPGAFSLLGQEHGDVMALCNAFKTAYSTRLLNPASRALPTPRRVVSGRTPNPYAAGQTPNPYASPALAGNVGGRATPLLGRATPNFNRPGDGRSPYPGVPVGGAGGGRYDYGTGAGGSTPNYNSQQSYPSQSPGQSYPSQPQGQGQGQGGYGQYPPLQQAPRGGYQGQQGRDAGWGGTSQGQGGQPGQGQGQGEYSRY